MANEIKITNILNYSNGTLIDDYRPSQLSLPQTNKGMQIQTVTATTVPAAVTLTGVLTPKFIWLQSLEATTTGKNVRVSITASSTVTATYGTMLYAKHIHQTTLASSAATITLQAETAASTIQVLVRAYNA